MTNRYKSEGGGSLFDLKFISNETYDLTEIQWGWTTNEQ